MGITRVMEDSADNIAALFEKNKNSQTDSAQNLTDTFSRLVQEKKEEYYEKLQTGTTEPSYQIGAGSYTQKQWDRLIKSFDAAQDALRKAAGLEERQKASRPKWKEQVEEEEDSSDLSIRLLMAETASTSCTYPSANEEEEEVCYHTFYSLEGIYCRKEGQNGYEWGIEFEDPSQYEKVMNYLNSLDLQDNLRFTCHENFWRDFLEDKVDMDSFQYFLDTRVANGVPDYLNYSETGVYVDRAAAQYFKYMNLPDFVKNFSTTEEEIIQTLYGARAAVNGSLYFPGYEFDGYNTVQFNLEEFL